MDNEYYTPKEVRDILGMTYSAIQNQVNVGNLHPVIPPGRRQRVYPKKEVDELKREMEAWLVSRQQAQTPSAEFVKATIEDMPEALALADAIFGGHNTIPRERRIAWLKKNPDIDYLLKQDRQLVGYFSLVPLRPETIDDLLKQRRFAKDLTEDDILTYEPGVPVDLYGMAIGVRPGVSTAQKRIWGEKLLVGARKVITDLGERGIIIRSIQAHSSMADGIRLMRHIGFTEVVASVPGLRDFKIDMEESGLPFVLDYRAALEKWKQDNKSLTSR